MTSKESQSAKFIDLHGHRASHGPTSESEIHIYSYSPKINELPYPKQYFSAGVHPWRLEDAENDFKQIKSLCLDENCLMVGEAGLDRAIETPIKDQRNIFEWHIKLSMELEKPLIIHNVRALDEILALHKLYRPKQAWVLHDFNGNEIQMNSCHEHGIYTSLGPRFYESKTAKIAKHLLKNKVKLEYIFFETDDRNELEIKRVYEEFARIQDVDLHDLRKKICHNLTRLLGKNLMS